MMRRLTSYIISSGLCLLAIHGCGGTLGGNPERTVTHDPAQPPTPSVQPALSFSLTDAPVEFAQHVYISVESLQISASGDSWVDVPLQTTGEVDLLSLQDGKTTALAAINSLPAGTYGQTRLTLSATSPGRLIDQDGTEHSLKIASGSESGLKLQTAFTIESGVSLNLVLDFDLRKSIKETGNKTAGKDKYMMKPTLRMIDSDKASSIIGKGITGSVVCFYAEGTQPDSDDACDQAISSATVKAGQLKQAFLPAGTYDIRVFRDQTVISDVQGVQVLAGQTKDLGTLP